MHKIKWQPWQKKTHNHTQSLLYNIQNTDKSRMQLWDVFLSTLTNMYISELKKKRKKPKHSPCSDNISFTYLEEKPFWLCNEWYFYDMRRLRQLSKLYVDVKAIQSEAIWDSQRLQPVTLPSFSLSLSQPAALLRNTSDLQFPRGIRQGWGGKWEKLEYSSVWDTDLCVCVWLECEWAWHSVWEMRMFHTMTTNVPIHYCFKSSICSVSIVWTCPDIYRLIGTDVSAVWSIKLLSLCNLTCQCADMTWVHVWAARCTFGPWNFS